MIAAALTMLVVATADPEPANDRLYRLGEGSHLLSMRLHDEFFENTEHRAKLAGSFEKACTAHFLTLRSVTARHEAAFRPIVVEQVRAIVPADRLAQAKRPIGHDVAILAWRGALHKGIKSRAAPLLAKAAADYQQQLATQLRRVEAVTLPAAEPADRSARRAPQLATECATYFGKHRQAILALTSHGERG